MKDTTWARRIAVLAIFIALFAITATAQPPNSGAQQVVTEYKLPPNLLAKAEALYHIRVAQMVWGIAWSFTVLLAIIWSRLGVRFRTIAEGASRWRFLQAAIFTSLLLITLAVLNLPLGIYSHGVSLQYGLSVQSWNSWFWDWTKAELIELAIVTFLVWGGYALLRKTRRWWLWAWAAAVPLMIFAVFIAPVVLDPLFNKFEPLAKTRPELVSEITNVVARGGLVIPEQRMFEMKASAKVTTYNAYVTGIGASKRVVVWDTTARDLTSAQTLAVFGHEMGHYVLNHIWKGLALGIVLTLIGLWLSDWIVCWMLARWGERWHVRGVTDWASLPVFLLVFMMLSLAGQPITAAFSRHVEHDADIYGLEVTHGIVPDANQAAAQSFQLLGEKALSYPNPNKLLVFWIYDHPTIADRVRFCNEYRPWEKGESTQFVK